MSALYSLLALSMKICRQPCTCNGVLGPRNLTQDRQANIPKIAAYKYGSLHGTFLCGDSLVYLDPAFLFQVRPVLMDLL